MPDTLNVIIPGRRDIPELTFEFLPRPGDFVDTRDLDGDLYFRVTKVIHSGRVPHSNSVPSTTVFLVEEARR